MTRYVTTIALTMILAQTAAEARPAVTQAVRKMQALYNTTRDLKGKFKQVYTDTLYNRKRTSFGYLYVKKPGMMRWNYVKPERKAFISDGKVLWVWEPADKQAYRNPLDTKTLSTGLTFLLGSGDLPREFNASYVTARKDRLGGPSHLVLKLTPKVSTAQYKYLVLAVRPTDFAVEESMVVSRHNRNHFIFSHLKFNTRLRAWRFKFRPPKGTRVVDGSKLRRK